MAIKKPPARGDLVKVTWRDVYEDATVNPELGKTIERVSYGLFWADELRGGHQTLVTTTTIDPDGPQQAGYCAYPRGMVLTIDIIKRHK